jgi:SulP family sulfate permease
MYPVNTLDSTGAHALSDIIDTCRNHGVEVYFSGVKGPVMDVMTAAGLAEKIGDDYFFHEVHDAVEAAEEKTSIDPSSLRLSTREPAEVK